MKIYLNPHYLPNTVLGPVTIHKDVVLPAHTINQVQDKTFLQETLDNQGHDIYVTIFSKEGTVKKAWKRGLNPTDSGVNLIEIPWDLKE